MPIRHLLTKGIGLLPAHVKFIILKGLNTLITTTPEEITANPKVGRITASTKLYDLAAEGKVDYITASTKIYDITASDKVDRITAT